MRAIVICEPDLASPCRFARSSFFTHGWIMRSWRSRPGQRLRLRYTVTQ
jgi:hypothetical protein